MWEHFQLWWNLSLIKYTNNFFEPLNLLVFWPSLLHKRYCLNLMYLRSRRNFQYNLPSVCLCRYFLPRDNNTTCIRNHLRWSFLLLYETSCVYLQIKSNPHHSFLTDPEPFFVSRQFFSIVNNLHFISQYARTFTLILDFASRFPFYERILEFNIAIRLLFGIFLNYQFFNWLILLVFMPGTLGSFICTAIRLKILKVIKLCTVSIVSFSLIHRIHL